IYIFNTVGDASTRASSQRRNTSPVVDRSRKNSLARSTSADPSSSLASVAETSRRTQPCRHVPSTVTHTYAQAGRERAALAGGPAIPRITLQGHLRRIGCAVLREAFDQCIVVKARQHALS